MFGGVLYFDHNATAPLMKEARDAWVEATERLIGNPSSRHRLGSRADAAMQAAREDLAAILGCHALDIIWTSGATESNNTVLHHFAKTMPAGVEIWVSDLEHPCVLDTAAHFFAARMRRLPAERSGVVSLDCIKQELPRRRPGLIAVMAANNETGVIQPWQEIQELCRRFDVPFFCDAVQWLGKLPSAGLGECDYLSGCAHKFGGPRGIGFLKVPNSVTLQPLILGGPQEDGRRAGTENLPGILSMIAALKAREESLKSGGHEERQKWREEFERDMQSRLPGSEVVGARAPRLWNTVYAFMPEADCQQRWVVKLDKLGIAVSTGSACASGREEASHVLNAMGYSEAESSRALRFSSGWETPREDWQSLLKGLEAVYAEVAAPARL